MTQTDVLDLLLCSCGASQWNSESDAYLQCKDCNRSFRTVGGIVDCIEEAKSRERVVAQWEQLYSCKTMPYSPGEDWITLGTWGKHLFSRAGSFSGKVVVDFGCGTAKRVAVLMPPGHHKYAYVGIDSSAAALHSAAESMPGSLLIRQHLKEVRIREASADFVLDLGTLMYFECHLELLRNLVKVLKAGGVMLIHEQVRRKRWLHSIKAFAKSSRPVYPDYIGINLPQFLRTLAELGTVLHVNRSASPVLTVFRHAVRPGFRKRLGALILDIDSLWCATVGRILPAIGAGSVQIVFRKRSG